MTGSTALTVPKLYGPRYLQTRSAPGLHAAYVANGKGARGPRAWPSRDAQDFKATRKTCFQHNLNNVNNKHTVDINVNTISIVIY